MQLTENERMIQLETNVQHLSKWMGKLETAVELWFNEVKKKLDGLEIGGLKTQIEILKLQMKIISFVGAAVGTACIASIVTIRFSHW